MNALIIGLTDNPGHFAHIIAYYKMCVSLGYDTYILTETKGLQYIPHDVYSVNSINRISFHIDFALIYTPNIKNLGVIWRLKRKYKSKVIYVFHEPLKSLDSYRRSGYNSKQLLKLALINLYHSLLVRNVDMIFLGSEKAKEFYDGNQLYGNKNRVIFPLIYDDHFKEIAVEKRLFSYIGNITPDHAFTEYLEYAKWAWREKRLNVVSFLIATKSTLIMDDDLRAMVADGVLTIKCGRPLMDEEIDRFFNMSMVVWNAYKRTTQSGVLPRSFMFGTPVLLLDYNTTSLTVPKQNCEVITDLNDKEQIYNATIEIRNRQEDFFKSARECFVNHYYWKSQADIFKLYLNQLLGYNVG